MNNAKYDAFMPRQVRQQSRWAEEEEIKSSPGVMQLNIQEPCCASGLPLISDGKNIWVDNSDAHSLIVGASGSKKTRLFAMPTLISILSAGETAIITDPKAELFERFSGYAKACGYRQFVLNFRTRQQSNQWNPLLAPWHLYKNKATRDDGISLLSELVNAICSDAIVGDPFWQATSRSWLMGMALLLFEAAEKEEEVNLKNLLTFCNLLGTDNEKYVSYINKRIPKDSLCYIMLSSVLGAADKTKQSIQVSVFSYLAKFMQNESLLTLLSGNDFAIADILKQKSVVWLIVPDEESAYCDIIGQFINQTYKTLILAAQKMAEQRLPRRVNFLLDEFANLKGAFANAPEALAAARSRNIRFFLFIQVNLNRDYKESSELIKANCANYVFLTSRDLEVLREFQELCGNGDDGNPLISASQLQRLKKERDYSEVLILHGRQYPFVSILPDIDLYRIQKLPAVAIPVCKNQAKTLTIQGIVEQNPNRFEKWFQ